MENVEAQRPEPQVSGEDGSLALALEFLDEVKRTRSAVRFIAWVVGIFAALSLISGIVVAGVVINAASQSDPGYCATLGGTDTSC